MRRAARLHCFCSFARSVLLLQTAILVVTRGVGGNELGSGFYSGSGHASGSGDSDFSTATPTTPPATNGSGPGSFIKLVCVVDAGVL